MDNQYITVDTGIFRSKWMPVAAIFTVIAAVLGLPGFVLLFSPEYMAYQAEELVKSGIASADARLTWQIINSAITVISFVCASIFAVGLTLSVRGNPGKGMGLLYWASQAMVYVINGTGIVLLAVLAYRVIRYVAACALQDTGVYLIYSMVVSEGILVVLTWFLFVNLRRFANCICDSAASMGFTLTCGKVDNVPIPAFTATGFLVLGIACLVMGLDRLVTVTVVEDLTGAYYALLPVKNPVQILEGASLLCSGFANLLISGYIRRYKRICERLLYDRRRELLFDP